MLKYKCNFFLFCALANADHAQYLCNGPIYVAVLSVLDLPGKFCPETLVDYDVTKYKEKYKEKPIQ